MVQTGRRRYDRFVLIKQRHASPQHRADDFALDVLSGDTDLFRWFLLCYLFGKPIRSEATVATWRLFIDQGFDTPWAIMAATERQLVSVLHHGGYTRYQHVTSHGMRVCMERLINDYEGSLYLMLEQSLNEDEFSKRLQSLYGVGPKIAEIFLRDVEEIFAQRVE